MSTVINVLYQGERLFSTNRGSCRTPEQTQHVYSELKERFRAQDGYDITVFALTTEAVELDPDTMIPLTPEQKGAAG